MVVSIKDIEQIGAGAWDRFIEQHPLGNIYHHSQWHRVIESTYGYRGSYCIIGSGSEIDGGLPFVLVNNPPLRKRLVSYPYSDVCDPLVKQREDLEAILGKIEEHLKVMAVRSAEIRTGRLAEQFSDMGSMADSSYCNFVLTLDQDKEKLFHSFHKNCVQCGIRKAQNYRLEVVEGKDVNDMKQFYRLHVGTRKRHGVPPQPFRFFRNLWDILYPRNMVSLLLARTGGMPIAGVVLLKFKDCVYYKFAAGERRSLFKRPNHLLIWKIIEGAVQEGYRYLDFGRTFAGDRGLMQWKARWGAIPKSFQYLYLLDPGGSHFNHQGSRANMILSSLLKKMPSFVVRMSGELFYRYLA